MKPSHNQKFNFESVNQRFRETGKRNLKDGREFVNLYEKGRHTADRYQWMIAALEELGFFSLEEFLDAESNQIYG